LLKLSYKLPAGNTYGETKFRFKLFKKWSSNQNNLHLEGLKIGLALIVGQNTVEEMEDAIN